MCKVRSREKRPRTKKIKYNGQQQKEMNCHEPHPAPNEKMQGIQWIKRPTSALVAAGSLWPFCTKSRLPSNLKGPKNVQNIFCLSKEMQRGKRKRKETKKEKCL
jgi:hypothetical protein